MRQANGEPGIFIFTAATDVTAMKQARQALERREKQHCDLVCYSQDL